MAMLTRTLPILIQGDQYKQDVKSGKGCKAAECGVTRFAPAKTHRIVDLERAPSESVGPRRTAAWQGQQDSNARPKYLNNNVS